MIIKITDKNQFNSESWRVKMSPLLHIFIHKTNNNSFLFEFKEWKFLNYKTHFSYTSDEVIECALNDFYNELSGYLKQQPKWEIDSLKYENLKFKTILYFNENHKELSGNIFSSSEQSMIKALNSYQEKDFENTYNILKSNDFIVKNNIDMNLLMIDTLVKLSNPERQKHYKFYLEADDYLLELYRIIKEKQVILSEKQQIKYSQIKEDFKKIPFPKELSSDNEISSEPLGIRKEKTNEILINENFLLDAIESIKNNDLNQAYNILSKAQILFPLDLNTLFLLAKLSMQLKKDKEIPGHIIALISEKESGKFTERQEIEFRDIIINYQKNNY